MRKAGLCKSFYRRLTLKLFFRIKENMRHKKGQAISGWLVIDKAEGIGSTDVVGQTRRLLNAQKNGHTGTLDPFATGVLPIAFGEATKLIPYVTDGDKEYEFTLCFGKTTDTLDYTGQIVQSGGRLPKEEEILNVLPKFIGEISQIPPAYSAIKINGKRAYDLAREGQDFVIPERKVRIFELELVEMKNESEVRLRVLCSKGTYVRTLGADIAESLGTLGYLTALRRTKCAKFTLRDTILLENLKKIEYLDERRKKILPVLTCLCDITVIAVKEEDAAKLKQGQSISPKTYEIEKLMGKDAVATLDNRPVAIVRVEKTKISPTRVFNLENE